MRERKEVQAVLLDGEILMLTFTIGFIAGAILATISVSYLTYQGLLDADREASRLRIVVRDLTAERDHQRREIAEMVRDGMADRAARCEVVEIREPTLRATMNAVPTVRLR